MVKETIRKIICFMAEEPYWVGNGSATLLSLLLFIRWMKEDSPTSDKVLSVLILVFLGYPIMRFVLIIISELMSPMFYLVLKIWDAADKEYSEYKEYKKGKEDYERWNSTRQSDWNNSSGSGYNNSGDDNSYNSHKQQNQRTNYSSSDEKNKNNQSNHSTSRSSSDSEFTKACAYYGVKMPFTEQEIKTRRRKLMKAAHPDSGGSDEAAELVNHYYEILKIFIMQPFFASARFLPDGIKQRGQRTNSLFLMSWKKQKYRILHFPFAGSCHGVPLTESFGRPGIRIILPDCQCRQLKM